MKRLHIDASPSDTRLSAPWVIALCAEWCSQCRSYRTVFEDVAKMHPDARFFWIDVEDEADLAGELDIETFPTVMVIAQSTPRFFGPLTSQPGVLHRLLQGVLGASNAPPVPHQPGTQELLQGLVADPARLASLEISRTSV